jgi:ATP-dependent RNA helicase DDX52/ROK1
MADFLRLVHKSTTTTNAKRKLPTPTQHNSSSDHPIAAKTDKPRTSNYNNITLFKRQTTLLQNTVDEQQAILLKKAKARHEEEINLFRKRRMIHVYGNDIPEPIQEFKDVLPEGSEEHFLIQNIVNTYGFETPTAIQSQLIPTMLSDRDCLAAAPTGSGKTISFLFPVIMNLSKALQDGLQAIIVAPTNELASQIYRECLKLTENSYLSTQLATKESKDKEIPKSHILVTTPMKALKLIENEAISLDLVSWLVLDECDKLLDLGLQDQVDGIISACSQKDPESRRVLRKVMLSATLPPVIEELACTVLNDHVKIIVGHKNGVCTDVEQKLIYCGRESGKLISLRDIFLSGGLKPPILLFVQSKSRAKELYSELCVDRVLCSVPMDVIHADQSVSVRDQVLRRFRVGEIWLLICSELLARGVDLKCVNTVVNYDVPCSTSSYVHRVGRTGRAGRRGVAYTMFTDEEGDQLRSIANVLKISGCAVPDWMLKR